jgi:predicted TIM-barrel fold metal-dependent hydrolase
MIIDSHCHLEPVENPVDKMIQVMDAGEVDKAVLLAATSENLPSIPAGPLALGRILLQTPLAGLARRIYEGATQSRPGKIKVSGRFYLIHSYPDNRPVAEALRRHPDRFIGFVFLNPKNNPQVTDQLEQAIEENGVRGVKAHSWWHDYDPGQLLLPVARRCQELGLPLLIHMGSRPDTGNVQGLLDAFPNLKLILAHLGIPWFGRSWAQAKRHPNVYLDISGPYLSAGLVAKAARVVGPDKLIYGTDGPYGLRTKEGGLDYAPSKAWVEQLPIGPEAKERVFSGNLLRLLG